MLTALLCWRGFYCIWNCTCAMNMNLLKKKKSSDHIEQWSKFISMDFEKDHVFKLNEKTFILISRWRYGESHSDFYFENPLDPQRTSHRFRVSHSCTVHFWILFELNVLIWCDLNSSYHYQNLTFHFNIDPFYVRFRKTWPVSTLGKNNIFSSDMTSLWSLAEPFPDFNQAQYEWPTFSSEMFFKWLTRHLSSKELLKSDNLSLRLSQRYD